MIDRLQKKCFIGSAMLHGLLGGILLFGMAFSKKEQPAPVLEIFGDFKVTDGLTHGGNPNVQLPPPPKPVSQPQPQPLQKVEPQPAPSKSEPRVQPTDFHEPITHKPDAEIQIKPDKKHTRTVDLTPPTKPIAKKINSPKHNLDLDHPTVRKHDPTATAMDNSANENALRRKEMLKTFASTSSNLRNNFSSSTTVEMPGNGGGPMSINFRQLVESIYDKAWIDPEDVTDDSASVKTEITIARSGNIVSARVTRKSGNASMDRSVQRALDRVRFIAPFPEGATDSERTIILNFNLKSKRQIG